MLQKILDLKELIVESRAVELEKANQDLVHKRDQLTSMQNSKDSTLNSTGDFQHSGATMNPLQLQLSRDYVVQLSDRIKNQEKAVAETNTKVSDQREALVKANQEKKILELLKAKHMVEYKKEVQKKEMLDESEIALRLQRNQPTDLD